MIALADTRPLVVLPSGEVRPFDPEWLRQSLVGSSLKAGYRKWWLTPHVLQSLIEYLEEDYMCPTITLRELDRAARTVLEAIGYPDIAKAFELEPWVARISLEDLARHAGCGYELAFFDLLRSRVREALSSETDRLEICDAHRGVKLLRSAKNWRKDCRGLLEEIVIFLRGELRAHGSGPVEMQLR